MRARVRVPGRRRPFLRSLVVVAAALVASRSGPAGCEIAIDDEPAAMMVRRDDDADGCGDSTVGVVDRAAPRGASGCDDDDDGDDDGGRTAAAAMSGNRSAVAPSSRGLEFLRGGAGTERADGGRRGGSVGMFRRALRRAVGGGLPGAVAGIVQVLSMMWVVSATPLLPFIVSSSLSSSSSLFFTLMRILTMHVGSISPRSFADPPNKTAHRDKLSISIRIVFHTGARRPLRNG